MSDFNGTEPLEAPDPTLASGGDPDVYEEGVVDVEMGEEGGGGEDG